MMATDEHQKEETDCKEDNKNKYSVFYDSKDLKDAYAKGFSFKTLERLDKANAEEKLSNKEKKELSKLYAIQPPVYHDYDEQHWRLFPWHHSFIKEKDREKKKYNIIPDYFDDMTDIRFDIAGETVCMILYMYSQQYPECLRFGVPFDWIWYRTGWNQKSVKYVPLRRSMCLWEAAIHHLRFCAELF